MIDALFLRLTFAAGGEKTDEPVSPGQVAGAEGREVHVRQRQRRPALRLSPQRPAPRRHSPRREHGGVELREAHLYVDFTSESTKMTPL